MLLFGSRALFYTVPGFREPVDWDVVGTSEDIARLDKLLPRYDGKKPSPNKTVYLYEGRPLEVVHTQPGDYWSKISEVFANEKTIDVPILGRLVLAPAPFCLITKQVGLIYRIHHWHKNLEDVYTLRNQIRSIPPHIEALLPLAQEHARNYYAPRHKFSPVIPVACHPAIPNQPNALHGLLHDRLRFGAQPLAHEKDAWRAFPHLKGAERIDRMHRLLAEEVMVFAAHTRSEERGFPEARTDAELKRYALREFAMSHLPEDWRYFLVNHYREIASLIPDDWGKKVADLVGPEPDKRAP
jgi:hypothetical protein